VYVRLSHPLLLVSHWSWYWHRKISMDILTLVQADNNRFELPRESFVLRDLPVGVKLAEVYPPDGWIPSIGLILPSRPMVERKFGDIETVSGPSRTPTTTAFPTTLGESGHSHRFCHSLEHMVVLYRDLLVMREYTR
jgi:hypothetical protein